jgi:hypothetical protein
MPGPRNDLMHRAHADDLARRHREGLIDAATLEFARGLPRAQKLAREIDPDYRIPLFQGHVDEGGVALEPRVADDDMKGAQVIDRPCEHRDDLVFPADVGFDRDRTTAQALDLMRDVVGIGGICDIVDDDVGARPRESDCNRFADT